MPTLLVIGYVWPEPSSSAAGRHMMSLLRFFKRQQWQVVFASPAKTTDFMLDLSREDIESVAIELNSSSFNRYIERLQPTAVMFDRFMMEEQFGWRVAESCPNAIRILDTEDLQCLRQARHQAVKQQRPLRQSDFNSELALREIAAIFRSDLSLIISSYEHRLLQQQFNVDESLLLHCPFLIDPLVPIAESLPYGERQHFVAIGNFRHAPNWDSVLYLKRIWPEIRKQLPNAELHIYGAYTPPKATALHDANMGFLIKDRADDATKVIANARVLLAPLRFGAGIKGKLFDAMLTRTPSVTSDIGAEGMTIEPMAWPGAISEGDDAFVEDAVNLYSNELLWHQAQQNIAPILSTLFNAESIEARLQHRMDYLLTHLNEHRQGNFIGAMLQHHSMKSTEFMSRWIEAKSRSAE